ncbi:hypothetical protein [Hydrocarboniphaga sp.]|uniref:hypothetical protein n=1 Tax=Hydrocarboniphaga sp. TaxID=2033016 RepID=UPI003D0DA552
MNPSLRSFLLLCAALLSPAVWAGNISESEPNNGCATAQDLDAASKFTVDGSIGNGDVDYYRFTAKPGVLLQVDLKGAASGAGTLHDSVVGLFDSLCDQIDLDDDDGLVDESLLLFTVPDDGIVTIAVAGSPDYSFSGDAGNFGSYQVSVGKPTTPMVSGKLIDAATKAPLPVDGFRQIQLMYCAVPDAQLCSSIVAEVSPDAAGNYHMPLLDQPPGTYQLWALASNYANQYSAKFTVDDTTVLGGINFKVTPLPLQISELQPCTGTAAGGSCDYHYKVTNTTTSSLNASLWSATYAAPTGSASGFSRFMGGQNKARKPLSVTLDAGASATVTQSLSVASMPSGARAMVEIFAANGSKLSKTIGHANSFAFTVGSNGALDIATGNAIAQTRYHAGKSAPMSADTQASAVIDGTQYDASTGQPLGDGSTFVSLQRCEDPSYDLCTGYIASMTPGSDGAFSFDASGLASGRYQLWAYRGKTYSYAGAFDFVSGNSITRQAIYAQLPPMAIGNVMLCRNVTALPAGSACDQSFELTNNTDVAQTVDVWTTVFASATGSPYGTSIYDIGSNGGNKPITLTLAAGATVSMTQSLPLGSQLKSGATGVALIYCSASGSPSNTLSESPAVQFAIVP